MIANRGVRWCLAGAAVLGGGIVVHLLAGGRGGIEGDAAWAGGSIVGTSAPRPGGAGLAIGDPRRAEADASWRAGGLEPDEVAVYRFQCVQSIVARPAKGLAADAVPGDVCTVSFRGIVEVTEVPGSTDDLLARWRFRAVSFGSGPHHGIRELVAVAERDAYVRTDGSGRVEEILLPAGIDRTEWNAYQDLVLRAQLVRPPGSRGTWAVEEEDRSGRFLAKYSEEQEMDAKGSRVVRILKEKGRYLWLRGAETAAGTGTARASFLTDRPLLAGLEVEEDLALTAAGGAVALRSRLSSRMELVEVGENVGPRAWWGSCPAGHRRTYPDDAWLAGGADARPREFPSWEKEIDRLERLALREEDAAERSELFSELVDAFEAEPERAGQAADDVREGRVSEAARPFVLSALGHAGTSEAQLSLVGIAGDLRLGGDSRALAITCLAFVRNPGTETIDFLERLAAGDGGDLDQAAVLALGALARSAGGEKGREILDRLEARLDASDTVEGIAVSLAALANARQPVRRDTIERHLEHPNALVRGAAVRSIAFTPGNAVDGALARIASTDPSAPVRKEAAEALRRRGVTTAGAR